MLELKSLWLSSVSFGIDFDWNRFYIGRTTTCRSFSLSWVDERNWTLDAGCTTFFIPQLCVFRNISLWGFFHLAVLSRFLHSPVLILLFLNILLARVCWNCTRHQLSTTFYFIFFFSTSFLLNSFKNIRLLVSYQTIDPLPPPSFAFRSNFSSSFILFVFFSIRRSDMGLYTEDQTTQLCCGRFTRHFLSLFFSDDHIRSERS